MPNIAAPFAHEGTFRKGNSNLTYIATPEAIERMNVCFGYGNWAFRALESFRDGDFIVCRGELSIKVNDDWVTYCQYGGQEINRKRAANDGTPGDIIDLADDYKGAASDAMKKCASHFGLGLYLALRRQPTPWSPNESPADVLPPNAADAPADPPTAGEISGDGGNLAGEPTVPGEPSDIPPDSLDRVGADGVNARINKLPPAAKALFMAEKRKYDIRGNNWAELARILDDVERAS